MLKINYDKEIQDCDFTVNNETFNSTMKICQDPLCTCTDLWLNFKNKNHPDETFSFGIDTKEKKLSESDKKYMNTADRLFAEKFVHELNENDWNLLFKIFYETKAAYTEDSDPEKIEAEFPWEDIENENAMIYYNQILPYGGYISFTHNSDKYFINDIYCVRTDCPCTDAHLEFYKMLNSSVNMNGKDCHFVAYNYEKNTFKNNKKTDKLPDEKILLQELKKSRPDFPNVFKKRHAKLKILYKNFLKREGIQAKPRQVFKTILPDFNNVGRNDPCPCGSGKKYKKCCLNK